LSRNYNDGFNFDGKGGTLAHRFYPGANLAGDLQYDDSECWVNGITPPGHNLYVVTVHEIGHCLGLTHSKDSKSVMYPTYNHELLKRPKQDILSDEDIKLSDQLQFIRSNSNYQINQRILSNFQSNFQFYLHSDLLNG